MTSRRFGDATSRRHGSFTLANLLTQQKFASKGAVRQSVFMTLYISAHGMGSTIASGCMSYSTDGCRIKNGAPERWSPRRGLPKASRSTSPTPLWKKRSTGKTFQRAGFKRGDRAVARSKPRAVGFVARLSVILRRRYRPDLCWPCDGTSDTAEVRSGGPRDVFGLWAATRRSFPWKVIRGSAAGTIFVAARKWVVNRRRSATARDTRLLAH